MPLTFGGPSTEQLRQLLIYDPETGIFTRRVQRGRRWKVGTEVGTMRPDGYRKVEVAGKGYLAHRLAFQYMTGAAPANIIDHINGDKGDNRWANLRQVDASTSCENRHRVWRTKRSSPLLGVTRKRKRWAAYITVKGKVTYLGTFDTDADAHKCYLEAKRKAHAGCTI